MKTPWMGVVAVTLALAVSGCGSKITSAGAANSLPVPNFAADSSMNRIQRAGKITVGVKFDQPGFGQKNPVTGGVDGFDIEIAKDVAQGIFGGTRADALKKIDFVEAVSKNREPFIQDNKVDLVIATYTIDDKRRQVVDFAGPYYVAHGDIMVKSGNTRIKTVGDLNGKNVCTVKGSTYDSNLKFVAPQASVTLLDTYSQCEEALKNGRVDAEISDNVILAGLAQTSNGALELVNTSYTDEPYGIGLKKGDDAFRSFLNDRLQTIFNNGQWKSDYEATLAKLGLDVPAPPTLDRYTTTPSGASTTTAATGTTSVGSLTTTTGAPPPTSPTSTAKP